MSYAALEFPSRVKSPDAFRTISEVSSELDVPQHVLRFWESRFAQVHPVKRAGGRRYYRPEDVDLLRGIRSLLYSDGYTIKGVQKLLKDKGVRFVADIGREGLVTKPALRPVAASVVPFERREPSLDEAVREKLEILLAELVQMKARMRSAPKLV